MERGDSGAARVLVTGASGFVGRRAVQLLSRARPVRAAFRSHDAARAADPGAGGAIERVAVGDVDARTDWRQALGGVGVVLHLAARVHVMQETAAEPLAEFRRVNVEGTLNLARQAAAAGVRRLVFMSSIKVNGEESQPGRPLRATDVPAPLDPYGISKLEAEQALMALSRQTGMEICVIRPVLVYGPGVKGNFHSLMRLLDRRAPLPFGSIDNRRSLVALDNLVDLAALCLTHPAAANETFLVSDDQDLSTTQLLRALAVALDKPARLIPVSQWLLEGLASLVGQRAVARRLFGTLQVDISRTRSLLGWSPPVSVEQGLRVTALSFRATFAKAS